MTPARFLLGWCSLVALLCSCTSQRVASQHGRSLRGVISGASFTDSDSTKQRRLHEDGDGSSVDDVIVVTEVVEKRGNDGEFDESLMISTIPAPETMTDPTPSPSPAPHHKEVDGGDDAAVPKSPSPIAAPHHHKQDPTQEPTTVPKKDPTPTPATASKEKKRVRDDDDNQVDNTAGGKETEGNISTFDLEVTGQPIKNDDRLSGEIMNEELSTPQVKSSNLPTKKPTETEQNEKDPIEIIDDDLVAKDDDVLEEELKEAETEAKAFGWFGFLIAIVVAMVFTAHQMSENPDGIYASLCRLTITIVRCVIKAVLMPFRYMLGYQGHYSGRMPISTTDPYRSHQMDIR